MQKLDFSLDLVVIKSYDNVFACFPRFLVLTIWKFELFSQNFFSWLAVNYVWVCLAMYLKPPLSDSLHHIFITRFFRNWSIWIQLEKGWGVVKLGGLQNSKNEWGEPLTSDPSANYDEIKFLIEEVNMFQEKHLDHEIRVSWHSIGQSKLYWNFHFCVIWRKAAYSDKIMVAGPLIWLLGRFMRVEKWKFSKLSKM